MIGFIVGLYFWANLLAVIIMIRENGRFVKISLEDLILTSLFGVVFYLTR